MPEGTSQPCPACGLMVMVGYAKCPKCHAPMPGRVERGRRSSVAGGTTSEPIERLDEGGGPAWIWAVVGVVVLAGVIILITQLRGESKKQPAEAAAPVENGPDTGSRAPQPNRPDEPPPPPPENRPDPAYVADALEGELSVDRLYATVEVIDELLDVRSAFCTDPRFSEIAARHIKNLKASGLRRIRCSETHGAQIFERPL